MSLSKVQLRHDRINLRRLVKRLEEAVSSEDWVNDGDEDEAWVKVNGVAQVS